MSGCQFSAWHFVRGAFGPWHFVLWHFVPWHYVRDSSNISPKWVKLQTSSLAYGCMWTISRKWTNKISENGRGLGHVTLIKFGTPSNIYPKRVKLQTSNLAYGCIRTISRKLTNKISENALGLGLVTLIICSILWDISKQESLAGAKVTHDSTACMKAPMVQV